MNAIVSPKATFLTHLTSNFYFPQYLYIKNTFFSICDFFHQKIRHNGIFAVKCVKSLVGQRNNNSEFYTYVSECGFLGFGG